MRAHINQKFIEEEDPPQYYRFINMTQKKATQMDRNNEKIDLFTVLDISGSMNQTCNKPANAVTSGAGYLVSVSLSGVSGLMVGGPIGAIIGGVVASGGVKVAKKMIDSRLDQAKKHLSIQIKQMIQQERINQLGLITFNQDAKIVQKLTSEFQLVFKGIQHQNAQGSTALYDSIQFAANQVQISKNPRILIMTDGQENSSKSKNLQWTKKWFEKEGLKSTFFTICEGNNQRNRAFAKKLQSEYIELGEQCWFSNRFNDESMVRGIKYLE